jgi:hypothetical protein
MHPFPPPDMPKVDTIADPEKPTFLEIDRFPFANNPPAESLFAAERFLPVSFDFLHPVNPPAAGSA